MITVSRQRGSVNEDVAIAIIVAVVFFSNALFPPLLPVFANDFHVRPLDFKWLVPGFSLVYGAATLAYGIISDRVERGTVLKWILWLAGLTFVALSFAWTANGFIALRALSGLGTGGIATICLSIIGDKYQYAIQGRPMGRLFGAIVAGMGLGASLSPILSLVINWRWILRAVSLLFFAAALWAQDHYHESLRSEREGHLFRSILYEYRCALEAARGSRALLFISANGVFQGGIFAWLGLLLAERYQLHELGIGLALIGYGVPDLILGSTIGGWADRYGRRYVLPGGFLWAAGSAAALAVSVTPWTAALSIASLSIGFDATHPLMSSITTSVDPNHRGQLAGLANFANFSGMAIGALIFGSLLPFSPVSTLLGFSAFEAIAGIAALLCFQAEKPFTNPEHV